MPVARADLSQIALIGALLSVGAGCGVGVSDDSAFEGDADDIRRACPDDGNACTVEVRHGVRCSSLPAADGTACPGGTCQAGACAPSSSNPDAGNAPDAGTLCGDGVRQPGEECDGEACCESCRLRPGGALCRPPASGGCDVAEVCDGVSAACPLDFSAADGLFCDTGICAGGRCGPSAWRSADIGEIGLAGSASLAGGTFTVSGAGVDVWGGADGFRFVYQERSGDFSIVARLTGLSNTHDAAKAGVMIRDSLSPGAAHAHRGLTPTGSAQFLWRPQEGAITSSAYGVRTAPPAWLKLQRAGSAVRGFESADGVQWTQIGQATLSLTDPVLVGLAVTSHDVARMNTATFDAVSIVSSSVDPCAGVTCSGHGTCAVGASGAACNCDSGYVAQGLSCVAVATSGSTVTSYGAVCDGATDDGPALQRALSDWRNWRNATLEFPAGRTCLSREPLELISASNVTILGHGAVIREPDGKPVVGGNYSLLFDRVTNLLLDDLDFDGNRDKRSPTEAWSHTTIWRGVKQSTIRNVDVVDSVVDGFYVNAFTPTDPATFNQDLEFVDCTSHNSFRQGMSIITGYRITVRGTCSGGFTGDCTCRFTGTNGTPPQAGIDVEPNPGDAIPGYKDVLIEGCLFADNGGSGVLLTGIAGGYDTTVRNNIFRGNGHGLTNTTFHYNPIDVRESGGIVENNWIGPQAGMHYGLVYIGGDPPSPSGRVTEVRNNSFDVGGKLPPSFLGRQPYLILFAGYGDGSPRFHSNTVVSLGLAASGDWCADLRSQHTLNIYGNRIGGVLQSPNPGCP